MGTTIDDAFTLTFWLTKACRIQMQILASNECCSEVPRDVQQKFTEQLTDTSDPSTQFAPGHYEWPALVRKLDDTDPSYRM